MSKRSKLSHAQRRAFDAAPPPPPAPVCAHTWVHDARLSNSLLLRYHCAACDGWAWRRWAYVYGACPRRMALSPLKVYDADSPSLAALRQHMARRSLRYVHSTVHR